MYGSGGYALISGNEMAMRQRGALWDPPKYNTTASASDRSKINIPHFL